MTRGYRFTLLARFGVALLPLAGRGDGATLKQVQTVPLPGVEGRFDHFAVDLNGQRLFLAALGNNTLEVIDLKAGRVVKSVPGLREPQGVAFAPDLNRVFAGCGEGGNCTILDGTSLAPVGIVSNLEDADNVRYDGAAKQVWVGYGNGALCCLDAATGKRLGEVKLAGHPESFQLEKAGPRLFVNVPNAGQVVVVDRTRRAVMATWAIKGAGANFPMAWMRSTTASLSAVAAPFACWSSTRRAGARLPHRTW